MSESTGPDITVFPSSMVAEVERTTFGRAAWTHEAHIAFATWVILDEGPRDALPRIRSAIRRLNESFGNENTADDGYHETITAFYVRAITEVVRARKGHADQAIVGECVARLRDREIPLRHWSRERLFSREARAAWCEPDLLPTRPPQSPSAPAQTDPAPPSS